ncbi:MAG: hypothetical protein U0670_05520 [Anaerolineae bacterium]
MTYASKGQGDLPIENFVSVVTDAVTAGKQNLDYWVQKYALSSEEADQFITVIRSLAVTLVPVKPSKEFSAQLKRDLMGQPERTLVERLFHLPPRVQIAAVAALGAGLWILARRRYASLVEEVDTDTAAEVATAR